MAFRGPLPMPLSQQQVTGLHEWTSGFAKIQTSTGLLILMVYGEAKGVRLKEMKVNFNFLVLILSLVQGLKKD